MGLAYLGLVKAGKSRLQMQSWYGEDKVVMCQGQRTWKVQIRGVQVDEHLMPKI